MLQELAEADSSHLQETDSTPVELVITPRKQIPKRDSIYRSLMERLHKTDSLLDFGQVRVQDHGASLPSFASDGHLATKQKLHLAKMAPERYEKKRTVHIQRLGTLQSAQEPQHNEDDGESRDEIEQLLEKLQEANFVASGRKGLGNQNQKQFVLA